MAKAREKKSPIERNPKSRIHKEVRPQRRNTSWGILTPEELARPGGTLLALILEAANTRGLSTRRLAPEFLGVTYSYFAGLRNGTKEIPKIGDAVITKTARFLGLPKVVVMLAAGQLKLEDFYQNPEIVQTHLLPALQFIQRDPEIGSYMPASVFTAEPALQQFIVALYEKAHSKTLIPSKVSLEEITERYKHLMNGDIEK